MREDDVELFIGGELRFGGRLEDVVWIVDSTSTYTWQRLFGG